jgi:hypothetical protein
MWGEAKADELLAAAAETHALWAGELDYSDLAKDIAIEARLVLALTDDQGARRADRGHARSRRPGRDHPIRAGGGRGHRRGHPRPAGRPGRFSSLAAARSFTGLVPSLDASGQAGRHGGPTKRGDAVLREALFLAADHARRLDPSLAARYHGLMTEAGKHHTSAICHIAPALLTRIIACWQRAANPTSFAMSMGERSAPQTLVGSRCAPRDPDRRAAPPGQDRPSIRNGPPKAGSRSALSVDPFTRHAITAGA